MLIPYSIRFNASDAFSSNLIDSSNLPCSAYIIPKYLRRRAVAKYDSPRVRNYIIVEDNNGDNNGG